MSEFEGKAGIVVGGGHGVGRATALALARLGARLLIVDVGSAADGSGHDPSVADEVAATITRAEGVAHALALDAGEPDAAQRIVAHARQLFSVLDFGVYAAGFRHDRMLLRMPDDELERVLAVHLFGPLRFARELARELVATRREGSLVLATSAAGFVGSAGQSALATAAGGLVGFVRTAAAELRRQGVRINALVPTARTRLTEGLPLFAAIRDDSLTPEHVAQGICHLLSSAAHDVHGEVIGVAGGRIYALRHAETSGAFHEGAPASLTAIAAAWRDVTRRS